MKTQTSPICDHIGIFTTNYKRLVDFYVGKLGFRKEKQDVLPRTIVQPIFGLAGDCDVVRLESGGFKIEIFQPRPARLKKRTGIFGCDHWGFCVGDRKRFCQRLKRKKVKVIEVKRNSHIVYFAQDPDGNRIEIRD